MRKIFVSDYDGTITNNDMYSLLAERYVPASAPDYFTEYVEGRITHFDAMAAYFAFMPLRSNKSKSCSTPAKRTPTWARRQRICSVPAGNSLSFRPAARGTSSVFSSGPAWPRLFTRTRGALSNAAGSCWRSWICGDLSQRD